MKSAKLSAEHQFILDCAGILEECDKGGLPELEARYEEFYGHVETLGRNLAEFLDDNLGVYEIKGSLEELFKIGLASDRFIASPLNDLERPFYGCGQAVQKVVEIIIPDNSNMPEPDDEKIKAAFRNGFGPNTHPAPTQQPLHVAWLQ